MSSILSIYRILRWNRFLLAKRDRYRVPFNYTRGVTLCLGSAHNRYLINVVDISKRMDFMR